MSGWERGTGSQCLPCRISFSPSKGTGRYLCCRTALQFVSSFPSFVQQTSEEYAILSSTLSCLHRNIVMWYDPPIRRIGVNECQISAGQCAVLPSRRAMVRGSHQGQRAQPCRAGRQAGGSTAGGCSEGRESLKSSLLLWNFWLLLLTPFGSDRSYSIRMDWEVSMVKLVLCLCEGTRVPSQHPSAGARSTAGLVLAQRVLTSPGHRMTEKGQSITWFFNDYA